MRDRLRRLWSIVLLLLGTGLFLYPVGMSWYCRMENRQYVRTFHAQYEDPKGSAVEEQKKPAATGEEEPDKNRQELEALYQQCRQYNEELYRQKQEAFCDPWSCTQLPAIPGLEKTQEEGFGYIQIDAMHVTLPLYLGASEEHMKKGAVILGQTSLPVGGEHTNSVIAAHRGYRGTAFFRDIENLQIHDLVTVHTFWGVLHYKVEEIAVIGAYDSDRVKIREGKDSITLLTCHPYRSHGRQRYVVFCERAEEDAQENRKEEKKECGSAHTGEDRRGKKKTESQIDIAREKLVRWMLGGTLLLLCGISCRQNRGDWSTKGERKTNV